MLIVNTGTAGLAANTGIVALSSNDYLIDWFGHMLESYESPAVSIVI